MLMECANRAGCWCVTTTVPNGDGVIYDLVQGWLHQMR